MAQPSTSRYGAILVRNAGMEARDGAWLATDVWRPSEHGKSVV